MRPAISQEQVNEAPVDLTKLCPVDPARWTAMTALSAFDAVLLSLGIEPTAVHEMRALQLADAVGGSGFTEPGAVDLPLQDFGLHQDEIQIRLLAVSNAVDAGTLPCLTGQESGMRQILVEDFVQFALRAKWHLPAWLQARQSKTLPLPPSDAQDAIRDGKPLGKRQLGTARTQLKYAYWQKLANEIFKDSPTLKATDVASRVLKILRDNFSQYKTEFGQTKLPEKKTIQNHIEKRSPYVRTRSE